MTEHTYAIGDRVAYVEPGRVFLGTVAELLDMDSVCVVWDDNTVDHDPWPAEALHRVSTTS